KFQQPSNDWCSEYLASPISGKREEGRGKREGDTSVLYRWRSYMRYRLIVSASLLCVATLHAQSEPPIHSQKLANGLEVIVIENHAVPIVNVELVVKNGGFTETAEYNGS